MIKLKFVPTVIGNTAKVDVIVTGFEFIGSFNISVGFDPAIAKVINPPTMLSCQRGTLGTGQGEGIIKFGWFTYPAETLPDESILFSILFEKVKDGTTTLKWLTDDGFSNGNWEVQQDTVYIDGELTFAAAAAKPVFPAKATVATKKKIMGYVGKQPAPITKKCSNCLNVATNKCKVGGYVIAAKGICNYHK